MASAFPIAMRAGSASAFAEPRRVSGSLRETSLSAPIKSGSARTSALGYSRLALSLTGRPLEGGAELERVIELARASQQFTPLWVSHNFYVFRCEITGEAASAYISASAIPKRRWLLQKKRSR